jgi:hypothetical protein
VQADEEDTDAVVDTEVRRMRAVVQCTTEDLQRTHTQLAVVQAELQQHLMELQQHLIELQQELWASGIPSLLTVNGSFVENLKWFSVASPGPKKLAF